MRQTRKLPVNKKMPLKYSKVSCLQVLQVLQLFFIISTYSVLHTVVHKCYVAFCCKPCKPVNIGFNYMVINNLNIYGLSFKPVTL